MRLRELACVLVLSISVTDHATPQQGGASNAESEAERLAAYAAITEAEKRLMAGERGPDSEPCRLMKEYFVHMVKAAAAAGAKTRVADWPDLTWQEQNAVMQTMKGNYERNKRMRGTVCTAIP